MVSNLFFMDEGLGQEWTKEMSEARRKNSAAKRIFKQNHAET